MFLLSKKGIVRKIDPLGRLVIPKEIRRELHLNELDQVEMTVDGECVIIRKYQNSCCLCGSAQPELLDEINGKKLCKNCILTIKNH